MIVEIRPEVATDLATAADWYDQREPGLGDEFMTEYRNALAATIDKPPGTTYRKIRSKMEKTFPLSLSSLVSLEQYEPHCSRCTSCST
jgi:hypothetical protein